VPSLTGVFGRDIGTLPGTPYSDALATKEGRWNRENLTAFLENPSAFAPGTNMPNQRLRPEDISRIVAALEANQSGSPRM